jgi:hypothetical protein
MNQARTHCSPLLTVGLPHVLIASAALLVVLPARSEPPDDYQCGKGEDVRRIEIRFEDEDNQLPCRVIYRPETENQSVGTVSWRGIETLESCQTQTQEVVDRLIAEGWNCAVLSKPSPSPTEASDVLDAAVDAETTFLETEDADQASDDEHALEATAILIENPSLGEPPAGLVTLIKQDLAKLDKTLDGALQAQLAAYSDLNADDVADALVLYTYVSPQPAYRQFLAAYLFDGETYQLTTTKPIASSSMDTKNATIDKIDQGIIQIRLQAFEPGDESCCPSGVREITLALRNLELVEIDQSAPIR